MGKNRQRFTSCRELFAFREAFRGSSEVLFSASLLITDCSACAAALSPGRQRRNASGIHTFRVFPSPGCVVPSNQSPAAAPVLHQALIPHALQLQPRKDGES